MATLNFAILRPNLFHLFDVEAFERTIEALVGFDDFQFFLPALESMRWVGRDEHQDYQLLLAAIADAVILS